MARHHRAAAFSCKARHVGFESRPAIFRLPTPPRRTEGSRLPAPGVPDRAGSLAAGRSPGRRRRGFGHSPPSSRKAAEGRRGCRYIARTRRRGTSTPVLLGVGTPAPSHSCLDRHPLPPGAFLGGRVRHHISMYSMAHHRTSLDSTAHHVTLRPVTRPHNTALSRRRLAGPFSTLHSTSQHFITPHLTTMHITRNHATPFHNTPASLAGGSHVDRNRRP